MAFIRDTRTQRNIGSSHAPQADLAAEQYMQFQLLGLGSFRSSRRYDALPRGAASLVYVPMTRGRPTPVVVPWADLDMKDPTHVHLAATHGFATKQIRSTQTVLNNSNRVVRLRGGHNSVNEEIRSSTGVQLRNIAGHYVVKAPALSATSASRQRASIDIPGARIDRLNLAGFNGDVYSGAEFNNPDFTNAGITFKGARQPTTHGARTGNMMVNRQSFGGLVDAVGRHATAMEFDYSRDGAPNFTQPSHRAMRHAVSQHVVMGPTPVMTQHLSASFVAHMQREMQQSYAEQRVSRRNKQWDVDGPQPH